VSNSRNIVITVDSTHVSYVTTRIIGEVDVTARLRSDLKWAP